MVNLGLDAYAHLPSPIHHWDPRYKLIGLMGLIFSISFVQDWRLLPFLLAITLILFWLSRLPVSFLLARLRYPGVFLLAVAVVLPLFSGETVLLQWGPLAVRQEGLMAFAVIAAKFFCILTTGIVLFGSAPFLTNIKAMRALRLSPILADMTLLTYRYIFEIGQDLRTMQTAIRLRLFRARRLSRNNLRTLAALSGTLLVRSYERSERIYRAMILRGYGRSPRADASVFQANQQDKMALVGTLLLAMTIIVAEIALRQI